MAGEGDVEVAGWAGYGLGERYEESKKYDSCGGAERYCSSSIACRKVAER